MSIKVAILGASDKPDRYSNMAFHLLKKFGHTTLPISPNLKELEGEKVFKNLSDAPTFHTLTIYVAPAISNQLTEEILKSSASRIIFNPGSENPELMKKLKEHGKEVVEGCTLVMLKTNQF